MVLTSQFKTDVQPPVAWSEHTKQLKTTAKAEKRLFLGERPLASYRIGRRALIHKATGYCTGRL